MRRGYTTFSESKKYSVEYKSDGNDVLVIMNSNNKRYARIKFTDDNTIERMIEEDGEIEGREVYERVRRFSSRFIIGTWKAMGTFDRKSNNYTPNTEDKKYLITITEDSFKFNYPIIPDLNIKQSYYEIQETNGYDIHIYFNGKHRFTVSRGYTHDHLWLWDITNPNNVASFIRTRPSAFGPEP